MIKALYLLSLFLFGCIASSLIAWLGALHEALVTPMRIIYIATFVLWCGCWLLDDSLTVYLKTNQLDYYGGLIAFAIALILGGLVQWLTNG